MLQSPFTSIISINLIVFTTILNRYYNLYLILVDKLFSEEFLAWSQTVREWPRIYLGSSLTQSALFSTLPTVTHAVVGFV